ncbi:MAG: polyprenyl synthetase family protein [Spirochaetes bacterium]|nr:polyprenyl synthetase family protein [Spirochaetota bacterium]
MKHLNESRVEEIRIFLKKFADDLVIDYKNYDEDAMIEISRYIRREGKYIRPQLFILTAELYGASYSPALLQCACSLELFHLFALAHDDIIDGDTLRGDCPSLGCYNYPLQSVSASKRILLGDILYSLAFKALTTAAIPPDKTVSMQKLMIETSIVTALGVLKEPLLSGKNFDSLDELFKLYWQKTGMYTFSSPMVGGYLMNKDDSDEIELLKDLGSLWGCAYQLQDDYNDCNSIEQDYLSTAKPTTDNICRKTKKTAGSTFHNANPNDNLLKEFFSRCAVDKEKYGTFENYVAENISALLQKARFMTEKLDLPNESREELINYAESFF